LNSKLLGMVFVMKFQAAAMSRSDTPEENRQDFALYVDEFQNFSTDSFATIMSEARKYHLNLIVANQFTTQLTDEIRDAVFGNIGTIVSFRIGQNDVDALSRYFQPQFDGDDLLRIPNYNSIVRTLVGGVPTQSFSMATLPPLGNPNPGLADALKQLSAAKYGKPKAVVEKAIFGRLATIEPTQPAAKPFQNPFAGGAAAPATAAQRPAVMPGQPLPQTAGVTPIAPAPATTPAPAGPAQGSFLDEWLAKQRANAPAPILSPARQSLPVQPAVTPAPSPFSDPTAVPSAPAPVLPTAAVPAPQPVAVAPEVAQGNVSSAQLDQQEIDEIAGELKKTLRPAEPAVPVSDADAEIADASLALPLPVTPILEATPVVEPPKVEEQPPAPKEGVLHLNRGPAPTPDDTIFIDNEGKLQLPAQPGDAAPKAS
jgi:hypothetical protein